MWGPPVKERDSQPSVLCEKGYVTTHKRRKKNIHENKKTKNRKKTRVAKNAEALRIKAEIEQPVGNNYELKQ